MSSTLHMAGRIKFSLLTQQQPFRVVKYLVDIISTAEQNYPEARDEITSFSMLNLE